LFWWVLNSGSHTYYAGALPLEALQQLVVFCSWVVLILHSLYILDISPLSDTWFAKMTSKFVGLTFHVLVYVFWGTKFKILIIFIHPLLFLRILVTTSGQPT
jgi:hypothetical protein